MKKKFLFIFICILFLGNLNAQDFKIKERKISLLFDELHFQKNDAKKDSINNILKANFKGIIENEESFEYDFLLLKNKAGILKSQDKKLRIYNWNTVYSDGSYKYFGFIQYYHKKSRKFKIFELNSDAKKTNINDLKSVMTNKNRIPALYYSIIYKKYRRKREYILLAWDGKDDITNRKLIEVLYFDKEGNPFFGKNNLNIKPKRISKSKNRHNIINNTVLQSRIIFEYSEQTDMLLHYDTDYKMIVFDHLSPKNKSLKGQYQFYGSDFTNDGLFFYKGKWDFYSNIKVMNKN